MASRFARVTRLDGWNYNDTNKSAICYTALDIRILTNDPKLSPKLFKQVPLEEQEAAYESSYGGSLRST